MYQWDSLLIYIFSVIYAITVMVRNLFHSSYQVVAVMYLRRLPTASKLQKKNKTKKKVRLLDGLPRYVGYSRINAVKCLFKRSFLWVTIQHQGIVVYFYLLNLVVLCRRAFIVNFQFTPLPVPVDTFSSSLLLLFSKLITFPQQLYNRSCHLNQCIWKDSHIINKLVCL